MKHLTTMVLIAFATLTFAACNTIEGAGKDIKAGGEKIEDTAADAKK
jgi:predicted small secreted protein